MGAPPEIGGILTLLLAGAALGLFARLRTPGWRLRLGAVATLAGTALAANLLWFPGLDAANEGYGFARKPGPELRPRYAESQHWIPRRKLAYFHVRDHYAGRAFDWVAGTYLEPRLLLALAEVASVREIEETAPLPDVDTLRGLPSHHFRQAGSWKKQDLSYRLHLVMPRLAHDAKVVAVRVADIDFLLPAPTWRKLQDRPRP